MIRRIACGDDPVGRIDQKPEAAQAVAVCVFVSAAQSKHLTARSLSRRVRSGRFQFAGQLRVRDQQSQQAKHRVGRRKTPLPPNRAGSPPGCRCAWRTPPGTAPPRFSRCRRPSDGATLAKRPPIGDGGSKRSHCNLLPSWPELPAKAAFVHPGLWRKCRRAGARVLPVPHLCEKSCTKRHKLRGFRDFVYFSFRRIVRWS